MPNNSLFFLNVPSFCKLAFSSTFMDALFLEIADAQILFKLSSIKPNLIILLTASDA